jgi:hypothetical protein
MKNIEKDPNIDGASSPVEQLKNRLGRNRVSITRFYKDYYLKLGDLEYRPFCFMLNDRYPNNILPPELRAAIKRFKDDFRG